MSCAQADRFITQAVHIYVSQGYRQASMGLSDGVLLCCPSCNLHIQQRQSVQCHALQHAHAVTLTWDVLPALCCMSCPVPAACRPAGLLCPQRQQPPAAHIQAGKHVGDEAQQDSHLCRLRLCVLCNTRAALPLCHHQSVSVEATDFYNMSMHGVVHLAHVQPQLHALTDQQHLVRRTALELHNCGPCYPLQSTVTKQF